MQKHFTKQEIYDMIESYQSFVCVGIEITSQIHANGPQMARQLISQMDEIDRLNKRVLDLETLLRNK